MRGQFFYLFNSMEKKRLRTITILFSKKNRNSQITNKNEINENKENERK